MTLEMKCQSQSGLLLLLIILAFSFPSGPAKAKGSEVQNEPYCDCRELFWILVDASIPFKVHTIKGQNCLVGQWKLSKQCCKICLNKIIKRDSSFILFIEKYLFSVLFTCSITFIKTTAHVVNKITIMQMTRAMSS